MSIEGITDWNSTGLKNLSLSFIMNINEHFCRIEIKVKIRLRNGLK